MSKCLLQLTIAALLAVPRPALAQQQVLDPANTHTFQLRDGTQVVLIGQASPLGDTAQTNRYFYLPTGLRLARGADSQPEFLFLKYTSDTAGVQGGLIHFLMEWGLTAAQQQEALDRLREVRPKAELMGAAQVGVGAENGSFRIMSATLSNTGRTRSLVLSKSAPVLPGGRVAAAADLDAAGASLLEATFNKTSDITVELQLSYRTMVPAAQGRIVMNWSRLSHDFDSLSAQYSRTETSRSQSSSCLWIFCVSSDHPEYSYTYDEMHKQYNFMLDKQILDLKWDEPVSDDRVTKIREAFFQYFVETFAQKSERETPAAPSDTSHTPDIRQGDKYVYKRIMTRDVSLNKVDTINLNLRLAFNNPFTLTGNLSTWYAGVRDNPQKVATVNLSQPFFEFYRPMFRVDLEAPRELFSNVINYVTITVHKDRPDGAPFERSITMDENYVKDHGVVATLTYARGTDPTPADFLYRIQWSLKHNLLYPANPSWQRSNALQAITLAPPVRIEYVEFEGDLAELHTADITRVTAQLHYTQYGREVEDNIQLRVAGGEPLVKQAIFIDRGAKGYAYRLIFSHKREGLLATPWSAQVGNDYIYARIPPDLTVAAALAAAKDSAKTIVTSATERVLDRFADVLGGGNH